MSDNILENKEDSVDSPLCHKVRVVFEPVDPTLVEKLKDQEPWVQKQTAGKVHVRPPTNDKHMMLSLNTQDSELFDLFNNAADIFTKQWMGFHQIGVGERDGLTAWELWSKPKLSDEELLLGIKEEMLKEATERVRWG